MGLVLANQNCHQLRILECFQLEYLLEFHDLCLHEFDAVEEGRSILSNLTQRRKSVECMILVLSGIKVESPPKLHFKALGREINVVQRVYSNERCILNSEYA